MDRVTDLPEWVDGPSFIAWLEEVRPDYRAELSESDQRTLHRFRTDGTRGSLEVVDRICVSLFLHISEIPDGVWSIEGPRVGRRVPEGKRREALEMIRSGTSVSEVARKMGVNYQTVRFWLYGRTRRG